MRKKLTKVQLLERALSGGKRLTADQLMAKTRRTSRNAVYQAVYHWNQNNDRVISTFPPRGASSSVRYGFAS